VKKLLISAFLIGLVGASDGDYVVMQFDAEFERKAAGIETVTAVFENGIWRVASYFIR